jgi:hypothetical protein
MELKSDARRVLALAKAGRTPSAGDKARVQQRLALALAASAAAAAAVAPASAGVAVASAGAGSAAAKPLSVYAALHAWIAGAALLAALTTGYLLLPASSSAPRARPVPSVPSTVLPARFDAPAAPPASVIAAAPLAPAARAPEQAPDPATHTHAPRARIKLDPTPLAAEIELLQRAQLAWREGAAAEALALLARHQHQFPHSQLALERDALRILSLCGVGEQARARSLAKQLLARSPEAPMRTSIERSCALQ